MQLTMLSTVLLAGTAAMAQVELVARIAIPGTERDLSKIRDVASAGVPQNRLGGFGSGIDYDAKTNRLWAVVDRGPADGESVYLCRLQVFELDIAAQRATLERTVMLTRPDGRAFVGDVRALAPAQQDQQRLDPEGIRLIEGGVLISDEYGPFVDEFSREGVHRRRIAPPARFMIEKPADNADDEAPPFNTAGRQPNRGFEGLALSADGSRALAILQGPLLQDSAFDQRRKRAGLGVRVLDVPLPGGPSREMIYILDKPKNGVSEIIAAGADRCLILERDDERGRSCTHRLIYAVSTRGAGDASSVASLPPDGVPAGVAPMAKEVFIDLLDPRFGLAGDAMPQKIEGLAWGPRMADGRATLIVSTDNDFKPEFESWLWVFAFDMKDVPSPTP